MSLCLYLNYEPKMTVIWSFILRFHSSILLNMKENKEKKSEDRRNQAM